MLDLRFLRTHSDLVRQGFAKRRQDPAVLDEMAQIAIQRELGNLGSKGV